MSALPEPTSHADECYTAENILGFVRDEAAKRDPDHAHHYAAASAASVKDGVDRAQRLLASHRTTAPLEARRGRGRRRRVATPDPALQEELSLVLALTWLEAAYGLLPPSGSVSHE